jgi:hypothetical protein
MKCRDYKNMIPEYISGELEESAVSGFEKHISECEDCKNDLETEIRILEELSADAFEVPKGLNEAVLSKIRPKTNIFKTFIPYSAAASIILILTLSFLFRDPAKENIAVTSADQNSSYSDDVLGNGYDELISYNSELFGIEKWTSENTDIFNSESDLINDILTLEELESYDNYLSSL